MIVCDYCKDKVEATNRDVGLNRKDFCKDHWIEYSDSALELDIKWELSEDRRPNVLGKEDDKNV